MPWVKTSDTFVKLPIWERLGADAYLLHMEALSHCNSTGTDGVLTRARARVLTPIVADPGQIIEAFLAEGFWVEVAGGIKVADYVEDYRKHVGRGDEQPTSGALKAKRDADAERLRKWREKNGKDKRNAVPTDVPNGVDNNVLAWPGPEGQGQVDEELAAFKPECEHGTAGGLELLPSGKPKCPFCRRQSVQVSR